MSWGGLFLHFAFNKVFKWLISEAFNVHKLFFTKQKSQRRQTIELMLPGVWPGHPLISAPPPSLRDIMVLLSTKDI